MNLSSFLASVLEQSAPILLAALAAMITLRANILNVAVEGMMLVAAFVASIVMSQLLALMTLRFSADFIVAGLGINLLAAGGSLFALEWFYRSPGGLRPITFPDIWHVPAGSLSFLPVIGPAIEGQSIILLLAFLAIPLSALFLYNTPTGAYLRAAGEDEHAARSAGIKVARMKALSLAISGLFAGLAGAQLAMDKLHFFLPDMTNGRGFIGLAATLFGSGHPWVTAAASVLFGFFGALGDRLQAFAIPSQFVLMLPYVAAIAGLTFARWRIHVRSRPARIVAKEASS